MHDHWRCRERFAAYHNRSTGHGLAVANMRSNRGSIKETVEIESSEQMRLSLSLSVQNAYYSRLNNRIGKKSLDSRIISHLAFVFNNNQNEQKLRFPASARRASRTASAALSSFALAEEIRGRTNERTHPSADNGLQILCTIDSTVATLLPIFTHPK